MAVMDTAAELRTDILDRAGEDGSDTAGDYYATAGRQLDRGYHDLCNAHPFLFLRADPPGVLRTLAPITAGTVSVTVDATAITFSSAPSASVAGWKIRITGDQEWYRIAAHTAGAQPATLDSAYNGTTDATASYTVYQDEYDLATDLRHIVGLFVAEDGSEIIQRSEEYLRQEYPDPANAVWPPQYFARIGERRIRFNGYPDRTRRIEYAYTIIPGDIIDDGATILVPRNWRYVVADAGLYWLYLVKNDSRADAAGVLYGGGREKLIEDDLRKRAALVAQHPRAGVYR